jgi:hypothetical protein
MQSRAKMNEPFPYEDVLQGNGDNIPFPEDPFVRWELVNRLLEQCTTPEKAQTVLLWFMEKAPLEWNKHFTDLLLSQARSQGKMSEITQIMSKDPRWQKFVHEYVKILNM